MKRITCPECGSPDIKKENITSEVSIYQCNICKTIWLKKKVYTFDENDMLVQKDI